jgi:hypothetical protein
MWISLILIFHSLDMTEEEKELEEKELEEIMRKLNILKRFEEDFDLMAIILTSLMNDQKQLNI